MHSRPLVFSLRGAISSALSLPGYCERLILLTFDPTPLSGSPPYIYYFYFLLLLLRHRDGDFFGFQLLSSTSCPRYFYIPSSFQGLYAPVFLSHDWRFSLVLKLYRH
jgi:hypothetical protein